MEGACLAVKTPNPMPVSRCRELNEMKIELQNAVAVPCERAYLFLLNRFVDSTAEGAWHMRWELESVTVFKTQCSGIEPSLSACRVGLALACGIETILSPCESDANCDFRMSISCC
jgi:hypothetical protein